MAVPGKAVTPGLRMSIELAWASALEWWLGWIRGGLWSELREGPGV